MGNEKRSSSAAKSHAYILKKLRGGRLSDSEIRSIITSISRNELTDDEISHYVSGVDKHGMSLGETVALTREMAHSGAILNWPFPIVADKHCVGGIPGNRTTPIVVSICAAAGVHMPKTSSRSITSAAGTADVMEIMTAISLSGKKLREVVLKAKACIAWCGALGLDPVDEKLIRLERKMNTNPGPQIVASILSKKIAAGSTHILIDIPVGKGAKFSPAGGKKIAAFFKRVANEFNLKTSIVFTDGSEPIGNGVGPVLEMLDVIAVLKRDRKVMDLETKSLFIAGKMLELAGRSKKGQGQKLAKHILESKKAWAKFNEIIDAQGRVKNPSLSLAKIKYVVRADKNGAVSRWDNKAVNHLAKALGCPGHTRAGIYINAHKGDRVKKGDTIMTLYAESANRMALGKAFLSHNEVFALK